MTLLLSNDVALRLGPAVLATAEVLTFVNAGEEVVESVESSEFMSESNKGGEFAGSQTAPEGFIFSSPPPKIDVAIMTEPSFRK